MIKLEKSVWGYIILVMLATYLVQILAIINGGQEYEYFQLFIAVSMFFPCIGAIIYLVKNKISLKYIDWKPRTFWYLLLSFLVPIIITLLGRLLFEKIGWGINNEYLISNNKVVDIDLPLLLGNEDQSISFFWSNFFISMIVINLINSVLAFGEEVGWRGFLQKKLLEQNSLLKSIIFLGLIWGFWHFPLILSGFNYPEYPILGAFILFPLNTIFISSFLALLTIKSKSVWPAVFAHGGINGVMSLLFEMDFGTHKLQANLGILGIWMIIGIISYIFLAKGYKNTNA
ncbi:CPBP family intramembrane glutamic endopeptidase [Aquimarina litoralis]|uniref:CPBP family intramembrane glutamic endopeptidase n=1 Tax=Aquimarina litoralis TaxID=584605 RepID=UPI001C599D88|nr:CPBP family intramembrane glutamic endopeptidase [Aquimarina litoralis]MBW1295064.1 CPBP family intramembrane metalloprotease [Aquimarina litoralis]